SVRGVMVKDTMNCSPRKARVDRQRQRGRVLSAIRVAGSKPFGRSLFGRSLSLLVKLAYSNDPGIHLQSYPSDCAAWVKMRGGIVRLLLDAGVHAGPRRRQRNSPTPWSPG